jgi:hypothetical protein
MENDENKIRRDGGAARKLSRSKTRKDKWYWKRKAPTELEKRLLKIDSTARSGADARFSSSDGGDTQRQHRSTTAFSK